MAERKIDTLLKIFLLWNVGVAVGGSMLYPYLLDSGLPVLGILVFFALAYLVPVLLLLPERKMNAEKILLWGLVGTGAGYFLLGALGGYLGLAAVILLGALAFMYFWAPFNALWFEEGRWGNAVHSAAYYAMIVVIGFMGPAAGGAIVEWFGYPALYVFIGLLLAAGGLFCKGIRGGKEIVLGARKGLEAISGFKTLFFLEGGAIFGVQVIIFIITLEYFSAPLDFGLFIAITSLIAVAISFLFAKISDEKKRRREFLVLTSLGMGASLVFAAFAVELWLWFAAMVLVVFFRNMFPLFSIALLVDKKEDLRRAMYGRELVFNFSRFIMALIAIGIYLVLGSVRASLLLGGIYLFAFAVIFDLSKRKKLDVK